MRARASTRRVREPGSFSRLRVRPPRRAAGAAGRRAGGGGQAERVLDRDRTPARLRGGGAADVGRRLQRRHDARQHGHGSRARHRGPVRVRAEPALRRQLRHRRRLRARVHREERAREPRAADRRRARRHGGGLRRHRPARGGVSACDLRRKLRCVRATGAARDPAGGTRRAPAGVVRPSRDRTSREPHVPHLRRDARRAGGQSAARMSAGAAHAPAQRAATTGRLKIALAATCAVALLEIAGGVRAGSLALLSDAVHVAMDVVALAIALAAAVQAKRPADSRRTYGFARYEILAALANGALLTAVSVLIAIEAVHRFVHPVRPEGVLMAAIAAVGLTVNVTVGLVLLGDRQGGLNVRAALLHVAGDALGALAVIAGGAAIALTGAAWIDPALSLFVAAIVVAGVVGIVREASDVLLESAPVHAAVPNVRARIR